MAGLGIIFHDSLDGPWEQASGHLRLELEAIRGVLNTLLGTSFNVGGTLSATAVEGDGTIATRYVSNTGTDNGLKWEQVDLSNGVKSDLPFSNIEQIAASKLLGRGSASGLGDIQEITLGPGLSMAGTTLSSSGGTVTSIATDDSYITGGPITTTGTIAASHRTRAAVNLTLHAMCAGL